MPPSAVWVRLLPIPSNACLSISRRTCDEASDEAWLACERGAPISVDGGEMSKLPQAVATVQVDDERVRVTEWRFAPGAETGEHVHQMDYVVVPLANGRLKLVSPAGEASFAELKLGVSYARKAGVHHNVINANSFEFAFIEIELKNESHA